MSVEILFFAAMKDHFPAQDRLILNGGESIADLRNILSDLKPEASSLLQVSRFAVNQKVVGDEFTVPEGAVIAVLPPSSGG